MECVGSSEEGGNSNENCMLEKSGCQLSTALSAGPRTCTYGRLPLMYLTQSAF
jgi:hypothetical protein